MNLTTWGTVTGSAAMMGWRQLHLHAAGGSWTGDIYGDFDPSETPAANQGADNFIWSGGTLNSGFYGQGGNDTATIYVPGSAISQPLYWMAARMAALRKTKSNPTSTTSPSRPLTTALPVATSTIGNSSPSTKMSRSSSSMTV
ncbi:hypothetical protein [uncultured Martelella sp.]|uniref:hypothetical protein n=1 Tax=uncultured Martelella sp. TaxID=392331 RepID=UPI0029C872F8|nr:hypothetical protein [uncultured Martelella sp.]